MKKRIGISFSRTNFQHYLGWFTEDLKNDLELIILSFEENNIEDIETCDGFVLTGGVDIAPELYNGPTIYENRPTEFQKGRDLFEKQIYIHARDQRLPLLGICRGFQLVNVLEGGGLVQDLGEQNTVHKKADVDKEHNINIEKDSLLYKITELPSGTVNSAHHQGVDPQNLSANLQASAYADGKATIIESFEFRDKKDKGFMLCVQWHPERMKDKDQNALSKGIKEKFIEEVKKGS